MAIGGRSFFRWLTNSVGWAADGGAMGSRGAGADGFFLLLFLLFLLYFITPVLIMGTGQ